jgi:hypothetical protein
MLHGFNPIRPRRAEKVAWWRVCPGLAQAVCDIALSSLSLCRRRAGYPFYVSYFCAQINQGRKPTGRRYAVDGELPHPSLARSLHHRTGSNRSPGWTASLQIPRLSVSGRAVETVKINSRKLGARIRPRGLLRGAVRPAIRLDFHSSNWNDLPRVGMHAEIDQSTGGGAVGRAPSSVVAPHARKLEDGQVQKATLTRSDERSQV